MSVVTSAAAAAHRHRHKHQPPLPSGFLPWSSLSTHPHAHLRQLQLRHSSTSFIKQVMDQVKRDIEKDPTIMEQSKKLEDSGLPQYKEEIFTRVKEATDTVSEAATVAIKRTRDVLGKTKEQMDKAREAVSKLTEENPALKGVKDATRGAASGVGRAFSVVSEFASKRLEFLSEDKDSAAAKVRRWKEEKEEKARQEEAVRCVTTLAMHPSTQTRRSIGLSVCLSGKQRKRVPRKRRPPHTRRLHQEQQPTQQQPPKPQLGRPDHTPGRQRPLVVRPSG